MVNTLMHALSSLSPRAILPEAADCFRIQSQKPMPLRHRLCSYRIRYRSSTAAATSLHYLTFLLLHVPLADTDPVERLNSLCAHRRGTWAKVKGNILPHIATLGLQAEARCWL